MKDQTKRIQAAGVALIAAVLAIGIVRSIKKSSADSFHSIGNRARPFHIELVSQEAATPGKRIYDEKGQLIYRCNDNDAAVAVFAMRDNATNADVTPIAKSATDQEGLSYATRIRGRAPFWVLVLEAGFPVRPSAISTTIEIDNVADSPQQKITLDKISSPLRALYKPTPPEVAKVDQVATATEDDSTGHVVLSWKKALPKGEFVRRALVGTSYLEANPLLFGAMDRPTFRTYFGDKIDAVKAKFDIYRNVDSETTLTYRKPEIVEGSGGNMIWLPNVQQVGKVLDYIATAGSSPLFRRPNKLGLHPVTEVVVTLNRAPNHPYFIGDNEPPTFLSLESIWPSPESMGLKTVNVWVMPAPQSGIVNFAQVIKVAPQSIARLQSPLVALKLRFKVKAPMKVGTTTLVLPLRHLRSGTRAVRRGGRYDPTFLQPGIR